MRSDERSTSVKFKIGSGDDDPSVEKTWPGAFAVLFRVMGWIVLVALLAQCESGRIW